MFVNTYTMKKVYLIIFSVLGLFHLGMVLMSFYVNSLFNDNNFMDLLSMAGYVPKMRWVAITGLGLVIVLGIVFLIHIRNFKSKLEALENEKNSFKAKMFDMQAAMESEKEESANIPKNSSEN